MNLLKNFTEFVAKENLFQPTDKLILAVSGGVDSVVLCELCNQAGYDFIIAHCNFQLRAEESERDEQFVKALGEKYGVEVLVKRFDTQAYASEQKTGIQEAARNLRYPWFVQLCVDKNLGDAFSKPNEKPGWHSQVDPSKPRWLVATAHHLDDSVETMLMNFFKGTGTRGMKGILPRHDFFSFLVRPLLFARKEELLAFATHYQLGFVEDSSNASDKYTRNYFRNQLIPGIKEVFPQVEENLINNLHRFREIDELYRQAVDRHKKKLLVQQGNEIHIPVLKLQQTSPVHTIVYEIIKEFGFTSRQADDVIHLIKSESGKYVQSSTHRVIKNRNWLIISPRFGTEAENILIEEEGDVGFARGTLAVKTISGNQSLVTNDPLLAQLDAGNIRFPLLLRRWKQGDYFYPLGMQKKKKLSRFLIDCKLSLTQKENVWVVEMNRKIIWVVGLRIDDRFKITGKTSKQLQLVLTEKRGA